MAALYTRRAFQSLMAGATIAGPLFAASSDAITGDLASWTKYPELRKLAAAFEYLKKTDFHKMEPGRTDIDGDRMYATLTANKAKLLKDVKLEAHRKYLDIHYLVAGQETIGTIAVKGLDVAEAYKEPNDIEFYKAPGSFRKIEMKPGHFAVFMPGQGHMPGAGSDPSAVIRKVVVKVRV